MKSTLLLASLVVVLCAGLAWQNVSLLQAAETQQHSLDQLLQQRQGGTTTTSTSKSDEVVRLQRELAQTQQQLAQARVQASAAPTQAPCPPPLKAREVSNELKALCREVLEEAHSMRMVSHYSQRTSVWDVSEQAFRALQSECNEILYG